MGVDQAVEVGGVGTLAQSMRAVRVSGCISLIGVLTGVTAATNPMPILLKSITVKGIDVGSRSMLDALHQAIALHQLRSVVDRIYSFQAVPDAYRYLWRTLGQDCGVVLVTDRRQTPT